MCGRYTLIASPEEVRDLFEYVDQPNFPPRYNIAPTQPIAVVRQSGEGRGFQLVRWGLIPSWVKDPKSFSLLINARLETAASKPSFRAAMQRRRCLVPASGFYEWQTTGGKTKQPYFLRPRAGGVIAFAGLWEEWSDPQGGEVLSGAILTRAATPSIAVIHHRMPAVVEPHLFDMWLDGDGVKPAEATELLTPVADDFFEAVPVSTRVNAVRNDDPQVQEPVEPVPPVADERPAEAGEKPAPDDGQMPLL